MTPGDVRALEALHLTYAVRKESAAALPKIREYAAQQPKSAEAQEFLGLLLFASKDIPAARKAFTAAKAADPGFDRADLSLIQLDVMEKNWNAAQDKLRALIAADEHNAQTRHWLGVIQEYRGDHQAALEQFRKAVEMDARNPESLNNLAYLLTEHANRPDEALKYAQKAQELSPDDPGTADTVGWILYRKGLYPAAITQLERAAARDGDVVWKYHLAMAYAKAGNPTRGRVILEAALKRNPNVP